jgi:HAMP domain-containing protein
VERLLDGIANKPTRPPRRATLLIQQARRKTEQAARQLAEGRCAITPAIEAASLLAAAEEAGADFRAVSEARSEIGRLTGTVERVCLLNKPRGR